MELTDSFEKISLKDIRTFERKFGVQLPDRFKTLYLESNGGIPVKPFFENREITLFAPIKFGNEDVNMGAKLSFLRRIDRIQDKIVPFAYDPFGGVFCFDLSNENYGTVHFLPNGQVVNDLVLLTSSFEDFIEDLKYEIAN